MEVLQLLFGPVHLLFEVRQAFHVHVSAGVLDEVCTRIVVDEAGPHHPLLLLVQFERLLIGVAVLRWVWLLPGSRFVAGRCIRIVERVLLLAM